MNYEKKNWVSFCQVGVHPSSLSLSLHHSFFVLDRKQIELWACHQSPLLQLNPTLSLFFFSFLPPLAVERWTTQLAGSQLSLSLSLSLAEPKKSFSPPFE